MIRVLILAAHLPMRLGLREMIAGAEQIEVIGEASSLDSAPDQLAGADVLLFADPTADDLRELIGSVPEPALLVLADDPLHARSLAGATHAWGILPLSIGEDELAAALHALGEGLVVGSPSLLRDAWRTPAVVPLRAPESTEQLTAREMEVLGLMARGLANKQIAAQLGISEHTVKFHLSSIYTKLGANSRTEAVSIGTRMGLIGL